MAPGERAILKVEWNTGIARGSFGSDIAIAYKRAGREQHQFTPLRIEARVIPDIEYQPARLVFASGKKAKQVLTFSPGRDPKAAVKRAYSSHRAFTARLLVDNSQVQVAFDPSEWLEGNRVAELTVVTTSVHERLIKVPLLVEQTQ